MQGGRAPPGHPEGFMPAPANTDEFLAVVRKSGVLEESRLVPYLAQAEPTAARAGDPQKFAGLMVRDGMLTFFQAEQFLQGKWKRFNIGKYRVLERLGAGGMGLVFLAEHKLMRRRVALKVLPAAKADDTSSLERFYREARAVAALDHPNIVRAYDIDQDENLHFLVIEWVDGASLQEIVKRGGPMTPLRACHYMAASAAGLQHAHENGLVHRDIKPSNILVDRQGVVKILDMGLARFFNDTDDMLTRKFDENVLGTADYLSPEQVQDSHTVDGRADIYSLGATFHFCLTGEPPFPEGTVAQKLMWHQNRKPKLVTALRPEIPAGIAAIVEKMMAKDPADRFQSPAELAAVLAPWADDPIDVPTEQEVPSLSPAVAAGNTGSQSMTGRALTASGSMPIARPGLPPLPGNHPLAGGSSQRRAGTSPETMAATDRVMPSLPQTLATASPASVAPKPPVPETSRSLGDATIPSVGPPPLPDADPLSQFEMVPSRATQTQKRSSSKAKAIPPAVKPKARPADPATRRKLFYLIGGGVGVILVLILVLWLIFSKGKTPTPTTTNQPANSRKKHVVSHNPGPLGSRTIAEAIGRAGPRDTIVVDEAEWEETLTISKPPRGLTIESGEGKKTIWTPAKGSEGCISIEDVDDLIIRGVQFRPGSGSAWGVKVTGRAGNVRLEQLGFEGFRDSGVLLLASAGGEYKPIVVSDCRFVGTPATQAGVWFKAPESNFATKANQYIKVEGSRFDGPFTAAAILSDGSSIDVFVQNCRFASMENGVYVRQLTAEQKVFWTILSNTFFETAAGLRIGPAVVMSQSQANHKINVQKNLFVKSGQTVAFDAGPPDAPYLEASANARDGQTKDGPHMAGAAQIDSKDVNLKRDDPKFLVAPAGLAAGAK